MLYAPFKKILLEAEDTLGYPVYGSVSLIQAFQESNSITELFYQKLFCLFRKGVFLPDKFSVETADP